MTAGMIAVPTIIPLKEPGSILAGSRKWMIDTDTLIDIHTSSKDCLLFYTLDTTKPDPFKTMGTKTTYQFTKPITLKTGKRTVKAIAVLKDGSRQSNVNTKVFHVSEPEVYSEDEIINNKTNTSWTTQPDSDDGSYVSTKLFKNVMKDSPGGKKAKEGKESKDLITKVLTDSPRPPAYPPIHPPHEDDVFRCIHCNTERPRDPYARFCNGCARTLPPAPGGIRTSQYFQPTVNCEECGYEKACETSYCRVCESMGKLAKPPSKQRINCTNCSSTNPVSVETCLVCDHPLDNHLLRNNLVNTSVVHKTCVDFIQCPYCSRTNSGDARFCDWCGKRPQTSPRMFACQDCGSENTLYSEYCCSCSALLKAPERKSFQDTLKSGNFTIENSGDELGIGTDREESNDAEHWKKITLKKTPKRPSKNIATQAGEELTQMTSNKSKLNSSFNYSPGKGFWRQQIEHICHHLKIYTQNNLEFRERVANHVMSRMVSGIISVVEGSELTLTANFAIKDNTKKKSFNGAASALTFINALTSSREGNVKQSPKSSRPSSARSRPTSARSRPSSAKSTSSKTSTGRKKKPTQKKFEKIEKDKIAGRLSKYSSEHLKVLAMIKSSTPIDEGKLEKLLNVEQFDGDCKDENDVTLLKLAVVNGHISALRMLVNAGATVNMTSGAKENTALHEAVSLGVGGKEAVAKLMELGASADVKDKNGKSPFDLAVDSGIESLIEKFTKLTSKRMLDDVQL